jgi:hypothetical protein
MKMTAFWDTALYNLVEVDRRFRDQYCPITTVIALIMDAVLTSETSAYFYETTWYCIPEGCHLHSRRRENLKSLPVILSLDLCGCETWKNVNCWVKSGDVLWIQLAEDGI